MNFTRQDYLALIDDLRSIGLPILPLEECYTKDHMNVISIRHDVDDLIGASFLMAEQENELGIRSTYFILDTAPYYWNPKSWLRIVGISMFGHNIGWHNNAMAYYRSTGEPVEGRVIEVLNELRKSAPVIGTASHGDPLCHKHGFLNYYIFKDTDLHPKFNTLPNHRFTLEHFGLKYEAYHTGHTHYISDSGGQWQQDNAAVIADVKRKVAEGIPVKLQVLIHPQWWRL